MVEILDDGRRPPRDVHRSALRRRGRRPWHWIAAGAAGLLAVAYALQIDPAVSPTPSQPAPRPAGIAATPFSLPGTPLQGNSGMAVLVVGRTVSRLDVDTGRLSPIEGLPPADGTAVIGVPLRGGTLLARSAGPVSQHSAGIDLYAMPTGAARMRSVGRVEGLAPAADPTAAWVTLLDRPITRPDGAGRLRLIDLRGRDVGPTYRLPAGRSVVAGLANGRLLTVTGTSTQVPSFEEWNPRTGRVHASYAVVLANDARTVVSTDRECGPRRCQMRATDVVTGRTRPIPLARERWPASATFSPDGSRLALTLFNRADAAGNPKRSEVVVLHLHDLRTEQVPASTTDAASWLAVAWSDDGRWLALAPRNRSPIRVALWTPAASRLLLSAPIEVPFDYTLMTTP